MHQLPAHQELGGIARPRLRTKKNRILDLSYHPPADGRVICFEEFGSSLYLQLRGGMGWCSHRHAARLRATYTRTAGVRQVLAALDLSTGPMIYRIHRRKRWQEFLAFLKLLRVRYHGRLYIILDNFSPHRRTEVGDWCADHDVTRVQQQRLHHNTTARLHVDGWPQSRRLAVKRRASGLESLGPTRAAPRSHQASPRSTETGEP